MLDSEKSQELIFEPPEEPKGENPVYVIARAEEGLERGLDKILLGPKLAVTSLALGGDHPDNDPNDPENPCDKLYFYVRSDHVIGLIDHGRSITRDNLNYRGALGGDKVVYLGFGKSRRKVLLAAEVSLLDQRVGNERCAFEIKFKNYDVTPENYIIVQRSTLENLKDDAYGALETGFANPHFIKRLHELPADSTKRKWIHIPYSFEKMLGDLKENPGALII